MILYEYYTNDGDWYDRAMSELEDELAEEMITYEDYLDAVNELNGELRRWRAGELRYYA